MDRWWSEKLTALHHAVRSAVMDSRRESAGVVNAKADDVKMFDLAANDAAVSFLKGLSVPLILDSEEAEQLKIGSRTPRHRLILDPVDGSDNWASGLPLSALSCAVLPVGAPLHVDSIETAIIGPLDEETPFLARKHGGAWQGDRRLETSHVESVEMALISCELNHWSPSPAVARLMARARGIRSYGCASRALALVASGAIDAHVDLRNRLTAESYLAAGRLVIEAGGWIVGLDGATMPTTAGLTDRIGLIAAASRPLCLEIVEDLRDGGLDEQTQVPAIAVILAAGSGSRLCPETKTPKPLTKVLGLTLAERVVCSLREGAGSRRFIVVLGHEAEKVRLHFTDIARRRGVTIDFVEPENWQLGNGASALSAKGRTGDASFFLVMTDHLFSPEIPRALARDGLAPDEICLAVDSDKSSIFDLDDVTRVRITEGRIQEIDKNLQQWDAGDTGVMLCTPGLFQGLERAAAGGRHGLSDGLRELAREGRARIVQVAGHAWLDIDTPQALREAKRRLIRDQVGKTSDGPVSRHLNRPLSRWLTRYLVGTSLTPNQVSLASFVLSGIAAALFLVGGYPALAAGGVIAQLASILDGCDGEIARLKRLQSNFGAWFDAILDRYADAFLVFGLMWHDFATTASRTTLVIGFAAIVGSYMNSYTADKYDQLMVRKLRAGSYLRLGRDVRVFVIFLGALFDQPVLAMMLIALVMNAEVLRRIALFRRESIQNHPR